VLIVLLATALAGAEAPKAPKPTELPLWSKEAPGALGKTDRDRPRLDVYLPPPGKRNGTGIVVCPGGGYGGLALNHEGKEIAGWLLERGVAAFVLHYRHGPRYRHPIPLHDVQRAVRLVRSRAKEYGVSADRLGVWGFSAGGHLASTLSSHFDEGKKDATGPVDRTSCRPDFAILCYPVIRLDAPHGHAGSARNLLGDKPDSKLLASLCNDTQVTKKTPPTFLFHTREDRVVPLANSELYHQALEKAGVPARLVIYDKGAHGVGLGKKDPVLAKWPGELEAWLRERKLLPAPSDR
jgi:acetyl esterase/lipase